MRWRIEQAEEFREEVEGYSDAERVVLADVYQALLRYGPLPHPSSPLVIHRFRDPRARGRLRSCAAHGGGRLPGARRRDRGPSRRHHPAPLRARCQPDRRHRERGRSTIADSTIMPRIVAVPTMPACVLIGLRLAEMLVGRGRSKREREQ